MDTGIIVAIITGIVTIFTTIITVWAGLRKSAQAAAIRQAVTDTKLEELTREVRKHNNFAERMPVVEEQIKVINHRITDLEKGEQHGSKSIR